jgi:hypothetical protein
MTTANNVKLIKLLSDRYKFDADDAIEYVKTSSKKGRPKKEIEVEQAKDLFDKLLEDAGEPPLEKDAALYKKFEKENPAAYGDDSAVKEEKVRLDPRCWTGKKIGNPKTKVKGGVRVNNCVPK